MKFSEQKRRECYEFVEENGLMEYGGVKLKDFCKAVDITQETYYQWMKDSEFSEGIKKAKELYKEGLEKDIVLSLAKSAKGYEYDKIKIEEGTKDRKVTNEHIHVQPNTGAAIFLLTNLNPEKWKNRQTQDVKNEVSANVEAKVNRYDPRNFSEEEMLAIADQIQEAEHNKLKRERGDGE